MVRFPLLNTPWNPQIAAKIARGTADNGSGDRAAARHAANHRPARRSGQAAFGVIGKAGRQAKGRHRAQRECFQHLGEFRIMAYLRMAAGLPAKPAPIRGAVH